MAYKNVLNLELTMIMEKGRLINCLNANVFPQEKKGFRCEMRQSMFPLKIKGGGIIHLEFENGLSNKVNGTLRKSFY